VQAERFTARWTGAEANVAVSLASFGHEAQVVSRVPEHELGDACLNGIRRFGVRVDHVARGGERLGLLYVEAGAGQRPTKVIYDRGCSSFATSSPQDYDWEHILDEADWLHFSGTAALNESTVAIIEEALRTARRRGITTSCDPNYRAKLWTPEEAGRALGRLLPSVDVLIGGAEDAGKLFGIGVPDGLTDADAVSAGAEGLRRRFGFRAVAFTVRAGSSTSATSLGGFLLHEGSPCSSRQRETAAVERIGGGDAFAAGIIHGMLSGWDSARTVEFAAAAACLKHTIPGDFNLVSVREVEETVTGADGTRVTR
jgi:2-dehydro-3-deoxygluconokinase